MVIAHHVAQWRRKRLRLEEQGVVYVGQHTYGLEDLPVLRENWHRIYHFRMARRVATGKTTVGVPTPFWSPHPVMSTVDPAVVKWILKDNHTAFSKGASSKKLVNGLFGDGLFAMAHGPHAPEDDAKWSVQRRAVVRVFSRSTFRTNLHAVCAKQVATLRDVIDARLAGGAKQIEMQELMLKFALDALGEIGLGVDVRALTAGGGAFETALGEIPKLIATRLSYLLHVPDGLAWLLFPRERELRRNIAVLDEFCYKVIQERRARPPASPDDADILSQFMLDDEAAPDDQMLRDLMVSLLFAGRDSSGSALTFALALLAQNPVEQDRARLEVKAVLSSRTNRVLTLDDIKQLPFLNGVFKETLRLFPPGPMDSKQAMCDTTLSDGTRIEKGTTVIYEIFQMGRDETLWPNAEKFDPDRWLGAMPSAFEFPVFQAGTLCSLHSACWTDARLQAPARARARSCR